MTGTGVPKVQPFCQVSYSMARQHADFGEIKVQPATNKHIWSGAT